MSLYDEAAVALIAEGAAGKDGVLYNIKPELEVYPEELTTNGDFATPGTATTSSWSLGWAKSASSEGDTVISGGKLTLTNAGAEDRADAYMTDGSSAFFDLIEGETYYVTYNVTDNSDGAASVLRVYAGSTNSYSVSSDIGLQSVVVTQSGSDESLIFQMTSTDASLTISNISVKRVKQAPLDFTFTRGSNLTATRVAPSGYIEKGRENQLLQSNQFDTTWTKTLVTLSSGQSGFDGSSNAWLVTKTTTGSARLNQTSTVSGVFTYSCYVKAGTLNGAILRADSGSGNAEAQFDLTGDGNVSFQTGSCIDTSITKIGSGWFRCSLTSNRTLTALRIYPSTETGALTSTGTIYIQNAQIEAGLVATDYIESHIATGKAGILEDSPRFDYTGGGCPHLLMEPTRKNLFQHSEYLAGSFNPLRVTYEENDSKSPEGVENAVFLKETSDNNTHGFQFIDFDVEDDEFYSLSFFVKANGREKFFCQFSEDTVLKMNVTVDLSGTPSAVDNKPGHTGSEEIIDYGDGWYRVEINGKEGLADDATRNINFFFIESADGTVTSYDGDTTKGLLFYGLQIEKGHFCTSYIPNHGTSAGVTRNDDVTNAVDFGDYMDGEDITWYVELAKNDELIRDGATTGIRLSTSDLNASSVKFYRSYAGAPDGIRTVVYFADDENDNDPASHEITEAGPVKVIVRRVKSTGEFTIFYDGAQKYQAFAPANYGKLKSLKIDGEKQPIFLNNMFLFDRALTDDECIALTT